MADNSKIRTIDDLIEYGQVADFSITKCVMLRNFEGIIIPDSIVYDKYRDVIMQNLEAQELSIEDQKNYLYRPDRFAMDMYGNPALSHLICYINKCPEYDFRPTIVYYLTHEALGNVLKIILTHESSRLTKAKQKALG